MKVRINNIEKVKQMNNEDLLNILYKFFSLTDFLFRIQQKY